VRNPTGPVLALNAGSSSVKFAAFAPGANGLDTIVRGQVDGIGGHPRLVVRNASGEKTESALDGGAALDHAAVTGLVLSLLLERLGGRAPWAAGHRVVHGGPDLTAPVSVTPDVLDQLTRLIPLAPLHQPHSLTAIRAVSERLPGLAQVACFDTSFHRGHPLVSDVFALPRALWDEGIRRYGFHGVSYEYIARTLRVAAPEVSNGRVVVAHLGNGASLCALQAGKSVDSTMSYTALDGLAMGTRPGALDPGVLLHLMKTKGWGAARIEQLLYHESGLLGLSGLSADMRELLASDTPGARLAVDVFVQRIVKETAALAAVLGGLDGLVFTAGIGENAPAIRERVCRGLSFLGIDLDPAANAGGGPRLTKPGSRVAAFALPTDEERMIALHTIETLERETPT
jgi:acetate kinase